MTEISVIIPTLNCEQSIGALCRSVTAQTVPCELIIIDSSSDDDTSGAARKNGASVIEIPREEFDHGGTRTRAARAAAGKFLVFLTQDVSFFDNEAIEILLHPFKTDPRMGITYGRQVPYPSASPYAAHLRYFNYPEKSRVKHMKDKKKHGLKTPFLSNAFSAFRKDVLREADWFREKLIMGEDTVAGAEILKRGYRIGYAAEAKVYHSHDYSMVEDFRRYFDIGVFHRNEHWIIEIFGSAASEGNRFVRSEIKYLKDSGKLHLVPGTLVRSFLKYTGYHLGLQYRKLPNLMIQAFSMHRAWWNAA